MLNDGGATMVDPSMPPASDKVLTLSNSISFLRILLIIPTVLTFVNGYHSITLALMVFAYITDIADGYVARRTNTISEFGKALDPIADKLYVIALILVMVTQGLVPIWFVILIITKDVLTMGGAMLLRRRISAIPPSNYWGKSAILVTIIFLFLALAGLSTTVLVFGWILCASLLVVSFVIYASRAWGLLHRT